MDINKTLRDLRRGANISVKTLSELSGVHVRTIEGWEYDNRLPSYQNLNAVLGALGYELAVQRRGSDA